MITHKDPRLCVMDRLVQLITNALLELATMECVIVVIVQLLLALTNTVMHNSALKTVTVSVTLALLDTVSCVITIIRAHTAMDRIVELIPTVPH